MRLAQVNIHMQKKESYPKINLKWIIALNIICKTFRIKHRIDNVIDLRRDCHLNKTTSGPDGFNGKFYLILKKITSILHSFFQKTQVNKILPNVCYEASISLTSKSKYRKTKDQYFLLTQTLKSSTKYLHIKFSNAYKHKYKLHHEEAEVEFILRCKAK